MTTKKTTPQNYHVFVIKYMGATNTKPSRYKIISERFNQSLICSYSSDQSFNSSIEYAIDLLQSKGFDIIGQAEGKDCDYIISNTFEPLKPF